MENIKTILKEHQEEIKRHIGVLKEDFDQKLGFIGEQHESIITRLDSHTEIIASIKEDMEIVKINVELIKDSLKRKVDIDEFATLERRVGVLEAKMHRD
jgi:hypothetical protein